jgi:hypothetical protein
MSTLDAAKSGSFKTGNEFDVNRLGFDAMQLPGKSRTSIWLSMLARLPAPTGYFAPSKRLTQI